MFVCDDNKREMANFSDAIYDADAWFDPLYQPSRIKKGKTVWMPLSDDDRFSHIINSAFAIKSQHSSLIQVADAVVYIFRRDLELKSAEEAWIGEKAYYAGLAASLHGKRERLGRNPGGPCASFYKTACHKEWAA